MTLSLQHTPKVAQDHPVVNPLNERVKNFSPGACEAARQFPLLVPPALAERIPWDQDGPLTRQFLPTAEELGHHPGDSFDPLEEAHAQPLPGLIHKYPGRVLLKVTTRCAVHCRFCFRRHARSDPLPGDLSAWQPVIAAIAADDTIHEVILSGGDPLTLPDRKLAGLARSLADLPHLTRLRIHSRMPVVTPERIHAALLDWLTGTRLTPVMVIHVNHGDELDPTARKALGRLVERGIPVLSQSVLLRGVNDDAQTLARLFESLIDLRVMPYYLHMLDRVAGAAHFAVSETRALALTRLLSDLLPGYALPRLVREVPGTASKQWLPLSGQPVTPSTPDSP